METLLDASETKQRLLQHGATLAGFLLLLIALAAVARPGGGLNIVAGIAAALGLAAIILGLRVKIRWQVRYKGHVIRFENDPLIGERLYIDGERVGRGYFGFHVVMNAAIPNGNGAGDRIESVSNAGLVRFQCRITATPATSS